MASVTLQSATANLGYVKRLLRRNNLPAQDLTETQAVFYCATAGDERVGVGGLEGHGDVGLLRSLVIEESQRGHGYGSSLCEALETKAREDGVETLYLLTTTAAEFFAARGYVTVERATVPDAIRDTPEFADLCPATATCMRKSL